MISGQMYSPRDLYFAGNIRLLGIRFMVISGQLLWSEKWRIPLYTGFFRSCLNLTLSDKIIILDKLYK